MPVADVWSRSVGSGRNVIRAGTIAVIGLDPVPARIVAWIEEGMAEAADGKLPNDQVPAALTLESSRDVVDLNKPIEPLAPVVVEEHGAKGHNPGCAIISTALNRLPEVAMGSDSSGATTEAVMTARMPLA